MLTEDDVDDPRVHIDVAQLLIYDLHHWSDRKNQKKRKMENGKSKIAKIEKSKLKSRKIL